VAMSASSPDPSWQLPLPPDAGPERRRVKPVHLLVGSLLALALLCCGGAAAVEVFTSGKPGKTAAAGPASDPAAAPTTDPTAPAVQPAVVTSATPTVTPSRSPRPRPATHKPTTEPTTRPPTKTPPPTPTTVPPTLPVVRAGSFCEPVGAFGITARGRLMRCVQASADDRPRWRAV
jgi:cell division septation protein DedD